MQEGEEKLEHQEDEDKEEKPAPKEGRNGAELTEDPNMDSSGHERSTGPPALQIAKVISWN